MTRPAATPTRPQATQRAFWALASFYMLIAFEFFYMASPFAVYFYSVYGPGLNFVNDRPALAWLGSFFLPHIVVETASPLLDLRTTAGWLLAAIGFLAFAVGASQVYYHKLTRKGAVTGGAYDFVRHPQYASLVVCSFGLLVLWPRFIALLMWIAMLFAYFFLARAEERECETRFGRSYSDYRSRTGMFLPFRVPLLDRLPALPRSGLKRLGAVTGAYVLAAATGGALATGLKQWSVDSLYARYTADSAYVSVARLDDAALTRIEAIVMGHPEIRARLATAGGGAQARFIDYVLPAGWYVAEIPMRPVAGAAGHHTPADHDRDHVVVVFTRVESRTNRTEGGRALLAGMPRRRPVLEALVDLSQDRVVRIEDPPAHFPYENVPVPVF